jgi:hypothetical protein
LSLPKQRGRRELLNGDPRPPIVALRGATAAIGSLSESKKSDSVFFNTALAENALSPMEFRDGSPSSLGRKKQLKGTEPRTAQLTCEDAEQITAVAQRTTSRRSYTATGSSIIRRSNAQRDRQTFLWNARTSFSSEENWSENWWSNRNTKSTTV